MSSVWVSVPCLDGKPVMQMSVSLNIAKQNAARAGLGVAVKWVQGESFIERARNTAVTRFLQEAGSEFTHYMTLDSDIRTMLCGAWEKDNMLLRLVGRKKGVVGGLYACKSEGPTRCSSVAMADQMGVEAGLIRMRWLSSGCMMVERGVLERMRDRYYDEWYDGDGEMAGRVVYGLYNHVMWEKAGGGAGGGGGKGTGRKLLSEDWSFCQRWLEMGGEIFADSGVVLGHWGWKEYCLEGEVELKVEGMDSGKEVSHAVEAWEGAGS